MKHFNAVPPKTQAAKAPTSSNPLLAGMYRQTSYGLTDNAALTFIRSGSACLDFYAQAGAMRKSLPAALDLFEKAFAENHQNAVRILFYLRDVRGGQGERDLFRVCLEWLGSNVPDVFTQIAQHIPEYGRWDDAFFDTPACINLIRTQLWSDQTSERPSLLAKWLPTINTHNRATRAKAKLLALRLDMNEIDYRVTVRDLRRKIQLVEQQMSAREWDDINYGHVPSQASRIYRKAFHRHDEARYDQFIADAKAGKTKINAGTLYPYQLYKSAQQDYTDALDALWSQLPDYTAGKNALVVADVSGSMSGDPMSVSVSLALYFAERNRGPFQNHFITFSGMPRLQRIVGQTLLERMASIEGADWQMNTNLQAVFHLILQTGLEQAYMLERWPAPDRPGAGHRSSIYAQHDLYNQRYAV